MRSLGTGLSLSGGVLSVTGVPSSGNVQGPTAGNGTSPPWVRPAVGAMTWVNQGGASAVDNANGPLTIKDTAQVNDVWRLLVKAVPGATPWTMTALVQLEPKPNFGGGGIVLRDGSTGTFHFFGPSVTNSGTETQLMIYNRWTNPTTFSGGQKLINYFGGPAALWLRVTNDGTNFIFEYSSDAFDWQTYQTVAIGVLGTVTQYGFALNAHDTTGSGQTFMAKLWSMG